MNSVTDIPKRRGFVRSGRLGWRARVSIVAVSLVLVSVAVLHTFRSESPSIKSVGSNLTAISADGTRIAYTKVGTGPALILVDGAFCYRENGPASALALLLADHFTVFAYDRRGRGDSGDAPTYDPRREVEDLQALIAEAGGSALVVANSSGGAVALHAAASGENVRRLVLFEPPFIQENGRPWTYGSARKRLDDLAAAGDTAGAVRFFMTTIYRAPTPFVALMPILMRDAWQKNQTVARTLSYDLAFLDDPSILGERSAAIHAPTLVVGGDQSPGRLKDAVVAVAGALPNATHLYLQGQNHDFSPAVFAPVIKDFFLAGNSQIQSRAEATTPLGR